MSHWQWQRNMRSRGLCSKTYLHQERRSANDNINTIDCNNMSAPSRDSEEPKSGSPRHTSSLDGDAGIVHMTPDVGQDLGLEAQLADGLAVRA
jgi:hypothetical protein